MTDKFQTYLGFARKSGNIVLGQDRLEKFKGEVFLLVFASDVAPRTRKNAIYLFPNAEAVDTDMTKEELGQKMGIRTLSVCGITDENFSKLITENSGR